MLEDKRKDLDSEKRKKILDRLVSEASRTSVDLYYQSTSTIARQLKEQIDQGAGLNGEERILMSPLSQRDIELLLSLHT